MQWPKKKEWEILVTISNTLHFLPKVYSNIQICTLLWHSLKKIRAISWWEIIIIYTIAGLIIFNSDHNFLSLDSKILPRLQKLRDKKGLNFCNFSFHLILFYWLKRFFRLYIRSFWRPSISKHQANTKKFQSL